MINTTVRGLSHYWWLLSLSALKGPLSWEQLDWVKSKRERERGGENESGSRLSHLSPPDWRGGVRKVGVWVEESVWHFQILHLALCLIHTYLHSLINRSRREDCVQRSVFWQEGQTLGSQCSCLRKAAGGTHQQFPCLLGLRRTVRNYKPYSSVVLD